MLFNERDCEQLWIYDFFNWSIPIADYVIYDRDAHVYTSILLWWKLCKQTPMEDESVHYFQITLYEYYDNGKFKYVRYLEIFAMLINNIALLFIITYTINDTSSSSL